MVAPNCPANYTWVPELGRTCLKVGEIPSPDGSNVDILSGLTLIWNHICNV